MEFGPVFRALVHNRARFLLITLEVALTLAIVANCVAMVLDLRGKFLRPSGYDEANLVVVSLDPFSPSYEDEGYLHAARARDLDRLRAFPGVRDATAISAVPLSGGGSSTGRKAAGAKGDSVSAPYFEVSDHALQALGVELVAGRDFQPGEFRDYEDDEGEVHDQPAILSQALADKLFPAGDAVGKRITSGGEAKSSNVVIGVVAQMFNSWPQAERISGQAMLVPGQPENERRIRYMVRTEPGARKAVMAGIEDMLLEGRRRPHRQAAQPRGDQEQHLQQRARADQDPRRRGGAARRRHRASASSASPRSRCRSGAGRSAPGGRWGRRGRTSCATSCSRTGWSPAAAWRSASGSPGRSTTRW